MHRRTVNRDYVVSLEVRLLYFVAGFIFVVLLIVSNIDVINFQSPLVILIRNAYCITAHTLADPGLQQGG